jgi:hypothetical protein
MSSIHDFDFLGPRWHVNHSRLAADGETWERFSGTSETLELGEGLGHIESYSVPEMPDGSAGAAVTVRLFDPQAGLWRVWRASSMFPGHLAPPMVGKFENGTGRFTGDDGAAEPTLLRFTWEPDAANGPRWQHERSADGGTTWQPDWTMQFERAEAVSASK